MAEFSTLIHSFVEEGIFTPSEIKDMVDLGLKSEKEIDDMIKEKDSRINFLNSFLERKINNMENVAAVQQAESQATQDFSAPVKHNTDFSLGIFGSSDNFLMATQMAKAFASSTIVPKEYQGNFANGLVAMDIANRLKNKPIHGYAKLGRYSGPTGMESNILNCHD